MCGRGCSFFGQRGREREEQANGDDNLGTGAFSR